MIRCVLLSFVILFFGRSVFGDISPNSTVNKIERGTPELAHSLSSSAVTPLDGQKGVPLKPLGDNLESYGNIPWFCRVQKKLRYHVNDWWQYGILFTNPVAAYGMEGGGSPLLQNRSYSFLVAGGSGEEKDIKVIVYRRSDFLNGQTNVAPVSEYLLPNPRDLTQQENHQFVKDDYRIRHTDSFGLTTIIQYFKKDSLLPFSFGWDDRYLVTHYSNSTDYFFILECKGGAVSQNKLVVDAESGLSDWSPIYAFDFSAKAPGLLEELYSPHFNVEPLPPIYHGKTVEQLKQVAATVNIEIPSSPLDFLLLDQSPELKRSPSLDQFVSDMGGIPCSWLSMY